MEETKGIHQPESIDIEQIKAKVFAGDSVIGTEEKNEICEILLNEGGESLYNYVEWLGLLNSKDLIVLSSQRHYFYTEDDIRRTGTIVNLKQLNQIRNLDTLIESIFKVMSDYANFVGCFAETGRNSEVGSNGRNGNGGQSYNEDAIEHGIISRIPIVNMIYNFIDAKTNRHLNREEVRNMFSNHGLKILDMTDLDGLVYFCARKGQNV